MRILLPAGPNLVIPFCLFRWPVLFDAVDQFNLCSNTTKFAIQLSIENLWIMFELNPPLLV